MAVTRLKRKAKRNKQRASVRTTLIKQLTAKPVIKNVAVEEIKSGFTTSSEKASKIKKKEEDPKAETTSVEQQK